LRKLEVSRFFNAIMVSSDIGWRKPHRQISKDALERLQVEAGEVVYVGDSPLEDIKGTKETGFRTVFVPLQFNSRSDFNASVVKPDCIINDLKEFCRNFSRIVT
jgi:putative hydrolase of the HAD superfamily